MYNGPHKFGRGGGSRGGGSSGGSSKRKSFPPPPQRHSTPSSAASNRLSISRTPYSSAPPTRPEQQSADESFRLVSGEPLSLATIFRLHPDLVADIRRLEAQGGAAKIKFDSNPKSDGNVIDVGGKEYRFTWADEKNCDIYEERQGGEDGNGLLVETGYVWRKLTSKRELDESTKRQVKMRSLQCEQSHKSRTTKPMEPSNPSMKNQMKALVAAEASPWKQKQKKDNQFKTRNFESSQAGGPAKPVQRPQLSSTNSTKGRHSNSPLPSPQNQYIHLASPSARGSASVSRTTYDPAICEARAKENVGSSNKIVSPPVIARMQEGAPHRDSQGAGVLDLERLLVALLKDNSKGMTLKALEKAVGDVTSGSARRIDPIVKKIATYEPPGRYILKPGIELGTVRSSPEDKHQEQFLPRNSGIAGKSPAYDNEDHVPLNNKFEGESNEVAILANSAPSQHLTDLFGDNEPPDHNERHAASSSNSDSDTESGSSDSGTNSASRSRSRSPVRSASASSSDSEADSSLNNKDTSDVEIDIMSEDDKEPKKLQDPLMPWSMLEARANGSNGDQDGNESEDVDIENDFLGDNEAELATSSHDLCMPTENIKLVSHDHDQQQTDDDKFEHKHFDSISNSEDKSKRGSNVVQNTDNFKRLEGRSLAQSPVSGYMGSHNLRSPPQTFPDTQNVNYRDNRILQMTNQQNRNGNSNVESLQSSRRPPVRSHTTDNADKSAINPLTFGIDAKEQEMNAHGDFTKQGYTDLRETQDEDGSINEKGNGSPLGQKSSMRSEPPYKHHNARSKKSSDTSTRGQSGLSLNDTCKADLNSSTKERRLRRELSDLEVGEFREPLAEEPEKSQKLFDRAGSFKKAEAKLGPGSRNVDLKVRLPNQGTLDPANGSSPNSRGPPKKIDSLPKRRSPEPYAEDLVRLQRDTKSQQQNSRSVRNEVESLPNQAVDLNRWENEDSFVYQGTDGEGYGETLRKSSDSAPREDVRQELESHKGKGKKSRKSKGMGDDDKRRDVSESRVDKRKRNEPSSDDNVSYSKFEKDEPELKEPIKSFSQYKEYVQEYRDKYDTYCSLNKILENYRNEFQKLGLDLESAKGRDTERYYSILGQLRDSYHQCGTRHKRLKKIFVVLHEELKDLKQKIKDFAVDYMRD